MGASHFTKIYVNETACQKDLPDGDVCGMIMRHIEGMLENYPHDKEKIKAFSKVYRGGAKYEAYDVYMYTVDWCRHYDLITDIYNEIHNIIEEKCMEAGFEETRDVLEDIISGYSENGSTGGVTTVGCLLTMSSAVYDDFARMSVEEYNNKSIDKIEAIMKEFLTFPDSEYKTAQKYKNPAFIINCVDATKLMEEKDVDSFVSMMSKTMDIVCREAWSEYKLENILKDTDNMYNKDLIILSVIHNILRGTYVSDKANIIGTNGSLYMIKTESEMLQNIRIPERYTYWFIEDRFLEEAKRKFEKEYPTAKLLKIKNEKDVKDLQEYIHFVNKQMREKAQ